MIKNHAFTFHGLDTKLKMQQIAKCTVAGVYDVSKNCIGLITVKNKKYQKKFRYAESNIIMHCTRLKHAEDILFRNRITLLILRLQ